MLKKIAGWFVIVLGLLTLLLLAGIVIGTWVGRDYMLDATVSAVTLADGYIGQAEVAIGEADKTLQEAQDAVDEVNQVADKMAAGEPNPVSDALEQKINQDVLPRYQKMTGRMEGILELLKALNATLVGINRLPGRDVHTFTEPLENVESSLTALDTYVSETTKALADRDGAVLGQVTQVTSAGIETVQTDLQKATTALDQSQVALGQLNSDVRYYSGLGAIALTLVTGLFIWGQCLLVGLGWRWARGRA